MVNDTIVALATPNMKSAISIIRVSGSDSIEIVNDIFTSDLMSVASHTINYGHILEGSKKIDEVLVSVFKAPRSFTTEDVVEINTHGGIAVTKRILGLVMQKGARLANAGEFTQRAYLNGRINMLEVEAINDMIEATNNRFVDLAASGLSNDTTLLIESFKERLLNIIAHIEVSIDYPEYDDVKEIDNGQLSILITSFKEEIMDIIKSTKTSKLIKHGLKVAIVGLPNSGKSSLLNAFLEEDKAIVTNIEGTTRDVVEANYVLDGIDITFLDTAGIRDTEDIIEAMGITKSIDAMNEADMVILLIDGTKDSLASFEEELIKQNDDNLLVVLNKADCQIRLNIDALEISALDKNIVTLKDAMIDRLNIDDSIGSDKLFLSNTRHLALLNKVNDSLEYALSNLELGMSSDILVSDLEEAYDYLQELLGQKYHGTLLDEMFSKFCLGK